jgi:hypothetical protein
MPSGIKTGWICKMIKINKMKTLLLGFLLAALVVSGSGCAAVQVLATVANAIKAEGWSYGHTFTYAQDETATTAFLCFSIQSARLATELNGYVPNDPTHRFLVVTITVENTFADNTAMWSIFRSGRPGSPAYGTARHGTGR